MWFPPLVTHLSRHKTFWKNVQVCLFFSPFWSRNSTSVITKSVWIWCVGRIRFFLSLFCDFWFCNLRLCLWHTPFNHGSVYNPDFDLSALTQAAESCGCKNICENDLKNFCRIVFGLCWWQGTCFRVLMHVFFPLWQSVFEETKHNIGGHFAGSGLTIMENLHTYGFKHPGKGAWHLGGGGSSQKLGGNMWAKYGCS